MCDFTDGESVESGSAAPTVSLGFNNSAVDTGTLGLTWTKNTSVSYDAASFMEGTHSLKRTTAGSNAGFRCADSVLDYSQDFTLHLHFANLVKPAATQYIVLGTTGGSLLRGAQLAILNTGVFYAGYTPGSGGGISVVSAVDVTGNATYQLVEYIWRAAAKTIELKLNGTSLGVSGAAADATPGVVLFDILGDGNTAQTAVKGNIDSFEIFPYIV